MIAPARLSLPLFALLALALWCWAARGLMPMPGWSVDPAAMTLDQIRLVFGLMPRGVIALLAGAGRP